MDNVPRSSFIPKQATGANRSKVQVRRTVSIVGIVSAVLFFGSVVAGAGLYGYTYYLKEQLKVAQEALAVEYSKFNANKITEVRAADEQLRAANYLLDHHTSPSKIFDALEKNTKQSVQYQTFSYEKDETETIQLNIAGVTTEFAKVSLQWTQYLQDVVLADVNVTRVGLGTETDEGGEVILPGQQVSFELLANIDAENIAYQVSGSTLTPVAEEDVADESEGESPVVESDADDGAPSDTEPLPGEGAN